MGSSFAPQDVDGSQGLTWLQAILQINRLPETTAYNVTYLVISISIALPNFPTGVTKASTVLVAVGFSATMLSKMHASIADALHDYPVDRLNPEKSIVAQAVDEVGHDFAFTLMIGELVVGLGLWGWLAMETGSPLFLICGVVSTALGFMYSYPPRFKERGIGNHIITTGVDVACVILPLSLLAGSPSRMTLAFALLIVFLYSFAYHIMHQAADTYYDRECGLNTFTQTVGVSRSVLVAAGLTTIAGGIAFFRGYWIGGAGIMGVAAGYAYVLHRVWEEPEQVQSEIISGLFNIGIWATFVNAVFAISLMS